MIEMYIYRYISLPTTKRNRCSFEFSNTHSVFDEISVPSFFSLAAVTFQSSYTSICLPPKFTYTHYPPAAAKKNEKQLKKREFYSVTK